MIEGRLNGNSTVDYISVAISWCHSHSISTVCHFLSSRFVYFCLLTFALFVVMGTAFLTLFLLAIYPLSFAGSLNSSEPCDVGNNRLQTGTYQFWSECNSVSYCDEATKTCQPKRCRKDDFPFGYPQGSNDIPPKCPKGEFCPDEGTDCQPLLQVGSACQLNRDGELLYLLQCPVCAKKTSLPQDQCEAPPNFKELADNSGRGLNFNGSVCLNNVCMYVYPLNFLPLQPS